jgi:hypothetical protein
MTGATSRMGGQQSPASGALYAAAYVFVMGFPPMLSSPCEIMPVRWYTNDGNPLSLSCIDTKIVAPISQQTLI